MHEFNDDLMPLLLQPFLFVALLLTLYFLCRFLIRRRKYYRQIRGLAAFAGSLLVYGLASCFVSPDWIEIFSPAWFLIYLFVILFVNILFSIWYKR